MKNTYFNLINQTYQFPQEGFNLEEGQLTFHGISIKHLIDKYGTPFRLFYLPEISAKIKTSALVVHCSGSIAIDELLCNSKKGVLYPIQTFSNLSLAAFNELPFLIESENKNDFRLLQDLVLKIGGKPIEMNSQKRSYIHLIAVIINNFGNHLIELGENIAQKHGIPFTIFHKIIEETHKNAIEIGARNSQTGPAKRKDNKTINKHLNLLSDEEIKKIYVGLTDSIKNRHE